MKTIKYLMMLAVATLMVTACQDGDFDTPLETPESAAIGNDSLEETNVVTIATLKSRYSTYIQTDYRNGRAYAEITEPTQIKATVIGNDIQGNLYNEIAVDDGTGALIISISEGGLYGFFPVGAEVLIELKGLYIGNYGLQAVIGTPYTTDKGTYASRINRNVWHQHYKLTGLTRTIEPITFQGSWSPAKNGLRYGGKLVTMKGVTFKGADGKATYANANGGAGSKSVYFNEFNQRTVMLYTSNYADFANVALPTGKVNVTGILKRYNSSWELIIRTLDDVEVAE